MKAFVINLARSPERRASMLDQLARSDLDYEFVDAIDGRALTAADRSGLVDENEVARIPWWLTPGTIGCALSHRRVYERILASGEQAALVLEDDVRFTHNAARLATETGAHLRGREVALVHYLAFGPCQFSSADSTQLDRATRLVYPMEIGPLVSAAAYVVTREACASLLEATNPVRVTADTWHHFYDVGALESLRCVVPRPVVTRKAFKSTMARAEHGSLRARATAAIARRRVFPLFQMMALNRRLVERRMSQFAVVPERSPVAIQAMRQGNAEGNRERA